VFEMSKFRVGNSGFSRFMNGKGFYIALALCLVAIGSAAYIATNNSMGLLNGDGASSNSISKSIITSPNTVDWDTQNNQPTNNTVSGIKAGGSSATISASNSVISKASSSKATTTANQSLLFMMPCSGDVINAYSNNIPVYNKTLDDWRVQDGVDIAAKQGVPVVAAADGTVSEIKQDVLFGQEIVIDHGNGIKSIYGNLTTNVTVKKAQKVNAGDVIGCVGQTAQGEISLVSHLYFAMTKNNAYIDPFSFVKKT
jgi:murein DD-endopeptidase MepM/ murein hydrolase activator NlpD